MKSNHPSTLRRLRRHQALSIRRPRQLCLRAERGSLWITVEGEPTDIALDPGQRRVFDGPCTVVVSALGGDAVFSLTPLSPPQPWSQRLFGWLGLGGAPVAGFAR